MAIIGEIRTLGTDDSSFAAWMVRAGWLPCDGRSLRTSDYRKLYSVLGPRWGSKDPPLTFLVPDLRGRFLRGRSTGENEGDDPRDPDGDDRQSPVPQGAGLAVPPFGKDPRAVGSLQRDGIRKHEHGLGIQRFGGRIEYAEGAQTYMGIGVPDPPVDKTTGGSPFFQDTRPTNVYVAFWIFAGLLSFQGSDAVFSYADNILASDKEYEDILAAQVP